MISKDERKKLDELNKKVQKFYFQEDYVACENMIREAFGEFPHAPHPHNLYGILLERRGNQHGAMAHYRAANALEPTYLPARYNLYRYGDFGNKRKPAFIEAECIGD